MIKGCEKRIIHIKNTNSPYFEEAYFILKDTGSQKDENDMIKEALKIAESTCAFEKSKKKKLRLSPKATVALSFCSAFFAFGIVMLILALLA